MVDYEKLNCVRLKIKTKKKPTCGSGYALQNYYRCIHNTRDWSPSKNPRRKLKLNPSATVKNTNCPFQMVVKTKQESCCTVADIEWEHNQSVQSLEASHFRDVSPDCVERVYQLFESGHTPSTARHQHLQDIRVSCKDGLNFRKKADTSVVPRRRDFNYQYTRTQFCKETLGGRKGEGGLMFSKLVENLPAI